MTNKTAIETLKELRNTGLAKSTRITKLEFDAIDYAISELEKKEVDPVIKHYADSLICINCGQKKGLTKCSCEAENSPIKKGFDGVLDCNPYRVGVEEAEKSAKEVVHDEDCITRRKECAVKFNKCNPERYSGCYEIEVDEVIEKWNKEAHNKSEIYEIDKGKPAKELLETKGARSAVPPTKEKVIVHCPTCLIGYVCTGRSDDCLCHRIGMDNSIDNPFQKIEELTADYGYPLNYFKEIINKLIKGHNSLGEKMR